MKLIRYMQLFEIDKNEKYQHLPSAEKAKKISRLLAKRFRPADIDQNRIEMLADKFDVTDESLNNLLNVISSDDVFHEID
ncbi:hypothetical protein PB1A_1120 [Leuconostoc inhae]|uniref:hypothetical protein n=1 Tax=Leuconostoc TaxID=1243 RepID=UPI00021927CC|nr:MULTISPECIES: hypothetical protein [Leuconostoc]MBA5937926.1 hypothetical protein [Leuconostoc citreum]MCS8585681.1 hypothetical protein [Leuconostoc mesenteroides]MDI6550941.1 hypothetical protein [Leuconostoc suionicum]MDI6651107.1 hypothetical protein [Leuconostoc suionicum]MDV8932062.1 hypothetical protein [Leuconostoc citreum]